MNNIMEKLGMTTYNGQSKVLTFDDIQDPLVKKELLLIQNVQLYKDFFAEEQLLASYRGQLSNLVNSSKAKTLVGYDTAYQHAIGALKLYIKKFNLENYKANKPLTYFTTNINFELEKLYKAEIAQKGVRISSDLSQHKGTIEIAKTVLNPQLGRNATNEEILNFIKKDMKLGSNLDIKKINRINHYDTKELSGSANISQENAAGAETLTFEDVLSKTESIDDLINDEFKETRILEAIEQYTVNAIERDFISKYLCIGRYKGTPKQELSKLRNAYGFKFYQTTKLIDGFRNFCKMKGLL